MRDVWPRLESWFEENAAEVIADLLPGASEKDFVSLERLTGTKLPDAFKAVYRVHNGQRGMGASAFVDWSFMSIKSIEKQWTLMKGLMDRGVLDAEANAVGPVKPLWWNPKWIPVGASGGGDFQCVDLDPAKGGKIGQIVMFLHMDGKREVVAPSLAAWMDGYATDYEKGHYKLEDGLLVRSAPEKKPKSKKTRPPKKGSGRQRRK